MIAVMQENAVRKQIDHAVERLEPLGLKAHLIVGTNRTVIAAIGDKRELNIEIMERLPSVEKAMRIPAPCKLASLEAHHGKTAVKIRDFALGEVHPDPKMAQLDGSQSLAIEAFKRLMPKLKKVAQAVGRDI